MKDDVIERERMMFEASIQREYNGGAELERDVSGGYVDNETAVGWRMWLARAKFDPPVEVDGLLENMTAIDDFIETA